MRYKFFNSETSDDHWKNTLKSEINAHFHYNKHSKSYWEEIERLMFYDQLKKEEPENPYF